MSIKWGFVAFVAAISVVAVILAWYVFSTY